MSYNATVKFSYISDSQETSSKYFPESINCKTITVEAPAEDLNIHQYYELFKNFLGAAGFCEYSIMDGACRVAFNDSNSEAQMKKVADEYDIFLHEEYHEKIGKLENQQDEYVSKLEIEIRELKEKLGDILPEQYGKVDAPSPYKSWDILVPGSYAAVENGCKCPVMDNAEMPDDKKWVNGDCPLHGKVR
jgi:hypothetical protein